MLDDLLLARAREIADDTRRVESERAKAIVAELEATGPHERGSWQHGMLLRYRAMIRPTRIVLAGERAGRAYAAG